MYIAYSTKFPGDFGKEFFQPTQFFVWVVLRQLRCLLDSMPGPQIFLLSFKTWFWANYRGPRRAGWSSQMMMSCFDKNLQNAKDSGLGFFWVIWPEYPPGNEHIPYQVVTFESMIFSFSPGGICIRSLEGIASSFFFKSMFLIVKCLQVLQAGPLEAEDETGVMKPIIQSTKQQQIFTHIFTNIRPKTHLSIQQRIFRYFCLRIGRGQVAPQQKKQRTGSKLNVQWRLDTVLEIVAFGSVEFADFFLKNLESFQKHPED